MGWFSDIGKKLDPTGNDFLGLGERPGRIIGGLFTGGASELHRPDVFGVGRHTAFSKGIGGSVTGAATGAATGFYVGGPYGAIAGGIIGGVAGGVVGLTGKSNNYTPAGFGKNIGIGVGSGLVGGAGANFLAAAPNAAGSAAAGSSGVTAGVGGVTSASGAVGTGSGAASPGVFASLTKGFESFLPLALLNIIQGHPNLPGTQGGSTGVTVNGPDPGPPLYNPALPPVVYPGVPGGLQTISAGTADAAPAAGVNWYLIGAVALVGFFVFRKKLKF